MLFRSVFTYSNHVFDSECIEEPKLIELQLGTQHGERGGDLAGMQHAHRAVSHAARWQVCRSRKGYLLVAGIIRIYTALYTKEDTFVLVAVVVLVLGSVASGQIIFLH